MTKAKDALDTLGTILDETAGRDAVHIAVEPVIAGETLYPGQHVRIEDGKAVLGGKTYGLVDPYLTGPVYPGQRFWFFVYPRQITSLRHVWAHPLFSDEGAPAAPAKSSKEVSEAWCRDLAENVGISYRRLMDGAASWVEDKRRGTDWPDYIIGGAEMEGECVPSEFWEHYQIITGETVLPEHRGSFFSCSC